MAHSSTDIYSNYINTVPANSSGLVACYKFDENAGTTVIDATANNNTGTLMNSPGWQTPANLPLAVPTSVVWTPGNSTTPSITVTSSGTYTATINTAAGCTASASKVVTANNVPAPVLGADVSLYKNCVGETTNLSTLFNTTGLTANWNTASVTNTPPGNYRLIATNNVGCEDTAYANVVLEVVA